MKLSDYVAAHGRPCTYEAGEYLFRQGEQDGSIYSLQSGLLKAYYLSEDGKEHIKSFILPGGKIGSLASSYQGEACTFSLVCLKPSALVGVNFSDLNEASRSDPELSGEIVDFLLSFGIRKEMREYELLCLSAEDRYKRLLEHTPDLFDLVTQNEIARYLGVTPVGLSRIKNRISQSALFGNQNTCGSLRPDWACGFNGRSQHFFAKAGKIRLTGPFHPALKRLSCPEKGDGNAGSDPGLNKVRSAPRLRPALVQFLLQHHINQTKANQIKDWADDGSSGFYQRRRNHV